MYKTDDVFQAAVLMCLDNPLDSVDSSGARVFFSFEKTEKLDHDLQDIISRKARVEPFAFKSNQDYLYGSVRSLTNIY